MAVIYAAGAESVTSFNKSWYDVAPHFSVMNKASSIKFIFIGPLSMLFITTNPTWNKVSSL